MNARKYIIFHIMFKLFAPVHISYSSIEEFILTFLVIYNQTRIGINAT